MPATLNRSLLSTNAIENVMRNYRGQTVKVARWRLETNPISRWTATALLHVELGFHRLNPDKSGLPPRRPRPAAAEFRRWRGSAPPPPRALLLLSHPPIPETNP